VKIWFGFKPLLIASRPSKTVCEAHIGNLSDYVLFVLLFYQPNTVIPGTKYGIFQECYISIVLKFSSLGIYFQKTLKFAI
jgi:hypothetical protein